MNKGKREGRMEERKEGGREGEKANHGQGYSWKNGSPCHTDKVSGNEQAVVITVPIS